MTNEAKAHRTISQLHAFVHGIIWMGSALLTLVMVFTLGPIYEGQHWPVTTNIKATFLRTEGEKMLFSVTGNKVRDCVLLDARVLVDIKVGDDKPPVKGIIWAQEDGEGPVRRALGEQDLGIWAVMPKGETATINATYSCHQLWETRVSLGTLRVGPLGKVEVVK